MRKLIMIVEGVDKESPVPYRVEYPFGLPGDGFRRNAHPQKATCIAYYHEVDPRLLEAITPGNSLRYDIADLAADMHANGWQKSHGAGAILVYVSDDGHAKIGEGNHRLAAALAARVSGVDVTIRYLGRSDERDLIWPFDPSDPKIRIISD